MSSRMRFGNFSLKQDPATRFYHVSYDGLFRGLVKISGPDFRYYYWKPEIKRWSGPYKTRRTAGKRLLEHLLKRGELQLRADAPPSRRKWPSDEARGGSDG